MFACFNDINVFQKVIAFTPVLSDKISLIILCLWANTANNQSASVDIINFFVIVCTK